MRLAQSSEMGKTPEVPKPGKALLRRLYVKEAALKGLKRQIVIPALILNKQIL